MLKGVKVVELAYFYPGPFCTQMLAELGAEVIKIEPKGGEPMRYNKAAFAALNRNKKCLFIDLKSEERNKFFEIVKDADVVVEGFRPGVAKKLGVDYDSVKEVNPSIVYCSISGFGQKSDLRDIPVHDINVLSFTGVCRVAGLKMNLPLDPNVQLSDFASAMFAAVAILSALFRKFKEGVGCYIDLSMIDSAFASIPLHTSSILNDLRDLRDFVKNPGYEIYKLKDGYISIGILDEPHFWKNLCNALNLHDISDLSYSDRIDKYDEIRKAIQERFREIDIDSAFKLLRNSNIPFGIVYSIKEALNVVNEQIICKAKYGDEVYTVVGFPAMFSNYKPRRDGEVC